MSREGNCFAGNNKVERWNPFGVRVFQMPSLRIYIPHRPSSHLFTADSHLVAISSSYH